MEGGAGWISSVSAAITAPEKHNATAAAKTIVDAFAIVFSLRQRNKLRALT
jgi:hypothetical protein